MSNGNFTPGQYVVCRASQHDKPQVRMFHSWNEPRLGHPPGPYARVTTAGVFQFDPNAPTESFLLVEPWVPEPGQWVFYYLGTGIDDHTEWQAVKITPDWYSVPDVHTYTYGGVVAPFTLPPFIAPGDKY